MTDRYEKYTAELVAEISYEMNPYGAVLPESMKRKFDLLKRINNENLIAAKLRELKFELSGEFVDWIKKGLLNKFTDKETGELYSAITRKQSVEGIFYNIVYCIIERFGFCYQCETRKRLISKDTFCTLVGADRKTLSRKQTIFYTTEKIKQIWLSDSEKDENVRTVILKIAEEIVKKTVI